MFLKLIFLSSLLMSSFSWGQARPDFNKWVLDSVSEMPAGGGYKLTSASVKSMTSAFTWSPNQDRLFLDPKKAVPSYCTTATYLIFYKVLEKYWAWSKDQGDFETLVLLNPKLDLDGDRIWGRWNSNGPGTAKLFYDVDLGENFENISEAKPGDFLKIFWNDEVGKNERGHTVIFLESFYLGGAQMIRFWGSNASTGGFGMKVIAKTEGKRYLFSRLSKPENIRNIPLLPNRDDFLSSMLTRVSNWSEVKVVSGINSFDSDDY